jgi:uncharacterized membrane protein YkoI
VTAVKVLKKKDTKMKKILGAITIVAAFGITAWAEKVTETQLPSAVQQTLNQQKGTNTVKDIEKQTRNGQTVYQVEFSRRGLNPKLVIAEDGTLVRDSRAATTTSERTGLGNRINDIREAVRGRTATMRIEDVPPAVRKTIEQEAAGRKVADIDRETWKGKTVYEVEFEQTGRNAQVYIAEDGTVVKQEHNADATGGIKGPLMGTQLSDTPPAVQETIKREAHGADIADIDKERRNGRVIYEVEFKNPGRNREIQIAEDGAIVQDNGRDVRGQGAAGSDRETRTGRTVNPRGNNLTFDQAPPAIQAAIRANGDTTTVKQIERGEKNGRTIYMVEFQKEGRNTKLQIAEDGTVLKDNRK